MQNVVYQKITLSFSSWFLTPLESDTILWYIFATNFEQLQDIFADFKDGNPPFLVTNGFPWWVLPRPVFFGEKEDDKHTTLAEDILSEPKRKSIKKASRLPKDIQSFELAFKTNKTDDEKEKYDEILSTKKHHSNEKYAEFKNSIPRFHSDDTTPFAIPDITYSDHSWTIYVKVFDEQKFQLFWEAMQNTLMTIGRWAKKSIGYGKIKTIECQWVNEQEQAVFDLIQQHKEKGQYYVLNNYKPTPEELSHIDLKTSNILYSHKHPKTFPTDVSEQTPFKGKYSFIAPWSVVQFKNNHLSTEKVLGESYRHWESFNFWYLL